MLREAGLEAPRRLVSIGALRESAWAIDKRESMALGIAGSGITTVGMGMVALLLCLFAWFPLFVPGTPEVDIAPVVAAAPGVAPAQAFFPPSPGMFFSLTSPGLPSRSVPTLFVVPDRLPFTAQRRDMASEVARAMLFDRGVGHGPLPLQGLAVGVDPD